MGLRIGSLPIGLSAYSFPWRCGFAGAGTGRVCATPYDAYGLLDAAARLGLSSVEVPLSMLSNLEPATLAAYRSRAEALGLGLACDAAVVDMAEMERFIPAAAALGAPVLRVMLSATLEGARGAILGGWEAHLAEMIARLKALRPLAEAHNVIIAPENHQDATTEDLLRVCDEVGGEHIGITLDAVNPLAVAQEPLAAARAWGGKIVNVHLKDYVVGFTNSGYRLVRCPLGEGALDLKRLFALLEDVAPRARCHIELAAVYARHIRIFEPEWWASFPPRDARELAGVMQLALRHALPGDAEWRTPWERGQGAEALWAYEEDQMVQSVEFLKRMR